MKILKMLLLSFLLLPLISMANTNFSHIKYNGKYLSYVKRKKINGIELFYALKKPSQINIGKDYEFISIDTNRTSYDHTYLRNGEDLVSVIQNEENEDGSITITFDLYDKYRSIASGTIYNISGVIKVKDSEIVSVKLLEKVSNQLPFSRRDSPFGKWIIESSI